MPQFRHDNLQPNMALRDPATLYLVQPCSELGYTLRLLLEGPMQEWMRLSSNEPYVYREASVRLAIKRQAVLILQLMLQDTAQRGYSWTPVELEPIPLDEVDVEVFFSPPETQQRQGQLRITRTWKPSGFPRDETLTREFIFELDPEHVLDRYITTQLANPAGPKETGPVL